MISTRQLNILVVGVNLSGSSAILDLLSEYSGLTRIPVEFDDFRRSGLIGDVISGHATFPDERQHNFADCGFTCHSPFKRATANQKLKSKVKWALPLVSRNPKFMRARKFLTCLRDCSLKSSTDEACEIAAGYIDWVARQVFKSESARFFHNPIFLGPHDRIWQECFRPFKAIFVLRDPLDQIDELTKWPMAYREMDTPIKSIHSIYGQGRTAMINFHVDAIKARHNYVARINAELPDETRIMHFEDLVRNYDKKKETIESFLGLTPSDHDQPLSRFKPTESAKNIGNGRSNLRAEEIHFISSAFNL